MLDLPSDNVGTPDLFGGILEAYQREGFEQGYARARHDLLAMLVFHAEQLLRDQPDPAQATLRKPLYAFVDRIERDLGREINAHFYVEGGLGI